MPFRITVCILCQQTQSSMGRTRVVAYGRNPVPGLTKNVQVSYYAFLFFGQVQQCFGHLSSKITATLALRIS